MTKIYNSIMDPEENPLKDVPAAQRFQGMMFLSVMWTTIFTAGAGLWYLFDELMFLHVFVITGIFVTSLTFRRARRIKTYRDHSQPDGTARYDDVWGA